MFLSNFDETIDWEGMDVSFVFRILQTLAILIKEKNGVQEIPTVCWGDSL